MWEQAVSIVSRYVHSTILSLRVSKLLELAIVIVLMHHDSPDVQPNPLLVLVQDDQRPDHQEILMENVEMEYSNLVKNVMSHEHRGVYPVK